MSDFDDEDFDEGASGPSVWADAPIPVPPPMRMFRVAMDSWDNDVQRVFYIDAHSVTCEGDAAKFYTYRADWVEGQSVLVAYCTRMLRPYLDVDEVTATMAATSSKMN